MTITYTCAETVLQLKFPKKWDPVTIKVKYEIGIYHGQKMAWITRAPLNEITTWLTSYSPVKKTLILLNIYMNDLYLVVQYWVVKKTSLTDWSIVTG